MTVEFRIGTSGWHYAHWQGVFYPHPLAADEWLAFYAQHFDTVEINSSFYRLPTPRALHSWRDATPKKFLFAIKASRYVTHMKKLKEPTESLANFLPLLESLEQKLGPVLFQLPPHWGKDAGRLAEFLSALPAKLDVAFELRDPSWHCKEIYSLLNRRNAAFCIFDIGGFCSPLEVTADFAYVRLHGPGEPYCGKYGTRALAKWASTIRTWGSLRRVYVYFDNDEAGFAVRDALELKALLAA